MNTKKALLAKKTRQPLSSESALSTGSTLLNLACTSWSRCGLLKGKYYHLVGTSTSGKTFISLTCFAESQVNEAFKDYKLILDEPEEGALMDIESFFGKKVADKMERVRSETVQDFYDRLDDLIAEGEPFVYVLDSQDSLDSVSARKKRKEQKKARLDAVKEKGSMGDGKAKVHSENIRWVLSGLQKTKSILIIISQETELIEQFSFDKRTYSGGKRLKFYAAAQIWLSCGPKLKKVVRGVKRTIGVTCLAEVRKNRVTGRTGRDWTVSIPIYWSYGIDDVGSCVDFMIQNKAWKKHGPKYECGLFNDELMSREEIIQCVERDNKERELSKMVGVLWRKIEDECQIKDRKKRYE